MQIVELMIIGFALTLFYIFCFIISYEILRHINSTKKPKSKPTPKELRSYTQKALSVYSVHQRENLENKKDSEEEEENGILLDNET